MLQNIGHLRQFLAVAREGSLHGAARHLNVSQPALTKNIRRLEGELGLPLFERRPRGMALTPAGEMLLRRARMVELECEYAKAEVQSLAHGMAGELKIGAGPFWGATTVLPRAIVWLQRRFPRVQVSVTGGVRSTLLPMLERGEIDVVVVGANAVEDDLSPGLSQEMLHELEMRVMAGEGHALLEAKQCKVSDLLAFPWVTYQVDPSLDDHLVRYFEAAHAVPPPIAVRANSLLTVMQLLNAGPYLTCLAEPLANVAKSRDAAVVPLALPKVWAFPTGLIYRPSLESLPTFRSLRSFLIEEIGRYKEHASAPRSVAP